MQRREGPTRRFFYWNFIQRRGYATLVKSIKSTKTTIPFSIYSMTFPFGTTGVGLTRIGVRPDHVITGANQRTLGAGNGERVGVDGWDRQKKICKLVQKYHRWYFWQWRDSTGHWTLEISIWNDFDYRHKSTVTKVVDAVTDHPLTDRVWSSLILENIFG